jgi:translation initiation factor 2B subunit (eIF-2B alpha/beta/delta family)
MIEETYLRLQHSESVVCEMASRFLAAYIASGQLTADNGEELVERSIQLAISMAQKADRAIESDDENGKE